MQTHVKVLAVLFIVFSALLLLAALAIMAVFGGAAGIVGTAAEGEDAAVALPIIGLTGTLVTTFFLVLALPGFVAGFGLLSTRPWARILGIVLCALNLIQIPLGTILGAYGLWVLLNKETERLFEVQQAAPTRTM
ncbi:MAG TPA: hypothetical protein VM791_18635 [Vicinamibacterales bacterium]|jgi:hypothetical protein|nr:hypothetical protein [Vicinamibacterales bacterium]